MAPLPNYYEILSIPVFDPAITPEKVKSAYKRASLLTHPDRNPNLTEEERRQSNAQFQKVTDAYEILSDSVKRAEYDRLLKRSFSDPNGENSSMFSSILGHLFNPNSAAHSGESGGPSRPNDPNQTFTEVFNDMMTSEVQSKLPIWKSLGTISGAALGFIVGNIPGLLLGSIAGNRLGSVRDSKGKSVYEVYLQLDHSQRAVILRGIALKVLGHALS